MNLSGCIIYYDAAPPRGFLNDHEVIDGAPRGAPDGVTCFFWGGHVDGMVINIEKTCPTSYNQL